MSTKRQYSLPNCSLILEGLEDVDTESVNILDGHPPMSILIDAQCIFLKSNQKLSGGSIFLQNLSYAVSKYAQSLLSGLSQPDVSTTEYPQITLTRSDKQQLHRLTYEPQPGTDDIKTEIDLSTVELFDLVDAIDRFYLDRSTLPNMTLELSSVSKRYRQPEQPLTERLTPVAIGFASLAIAAGALFIIPPPKTAPPESNPLNKTTETESGKTGPNPINRSNSEPNN